MYAANKDRRGVKVDGVTQVSGAVETMKGI